MTDQRWRSSDVEGPVFQPTNGWRRFFFADTSWWLLLALTGPLLVLRFVVVSQDARVFSRGMVWDLLYLLGGAWHLHAGHVPHVEFHSELGVLNFLLVDLAFKVVGTNVSAAVFAKEIVGVSIFVVASVASARRLPLVPAIVFVLLAWGMAILPTNIGESVNEYTFAMSYNIYGWAAISVLSLILFVPPRSVAAPWAAGPWIDPVLAGLLVVAMYYLKITYFGAAVAELAVAFVACRHMRAMWRTWSVVMAVVLANAVAPYNWPYLGDLMAAVRTGAATISPVAILMPLFDNTDELVMYGVAFLIGAMLWRSGRASLSVPVGIATCVVSAIAILSQNTQGEGLPLGLVAAFILYDCLCRAPPAGGGVRPVWILLAVLVMPTAIMAKQATSVVAYRLSLSRGENLLVVDHGNLKGLAVPLERDDLLTAFADGRADYTFLNRTREAGTSEEITQFEYIQTILEADALLSKPGMKPGGIVVLDQANPMPFVMNWPPPRGGSMWLAPTFPWRPAESTFAEVDYVLIPKFSTFRAVTQEAQSRFGAYLEVHFPVRSESRSWILLRRVAQ